MSRRKSANVPSHLNNLTPVHEQGSGEKQNINFYDKDSEGLLKFPLEAVLQTIVNYHASFPCPYRTRNFINREGTTQHNPFDNDPDERHYTSCQGLKEYKLAHPGCDVSSAGPDMQARFRRLASDLEHMYIQIDVRFFRYHRVGRRYMDAEIIPKYWPRNSECYNFIERRLYTRVQHLLRTQIKMYVQFLDVYDAEAWLEQTWTERTRSLLELWEVSPLGAAFASNVIVSDVVDFDGMFRSEEQTRFKFQLFCKWKFIISCTLLFPLFIECSDDDNDVATNDDKQAGPKEKMYTTPELQLDSEDVAPPAWMKEAVRVYRTVPFYPDLKSFAGKSEKMADIRVQSWVADVKASKLYSLKDKFVFTERYKVAKSHEGTPGGSCGSCPCCHQPTEGDPEHFELSHHTQAVQRIRDSGSGGMHGKQAHLLDLAKALTRNSGPSPSMSASSTAVMSNLGKIDLTPGPSSSKAKNDTTGVSKPRDKVPCKDTIGWTESSIPRDEESLRKRLRELELAVEKGRETQSRLQRELAVAERRKRNAGV